MGLRPPWDVAMATGTPWGPLTGDGGGDGAAQGGDGGHGDLLGAVLLGAGVAGGHHVGLQQGPLQVDVVVAQRLVDGRQHLGTRGQGGGDADMAGGDLGDVTEGTVGMAPTFSVTYWQCFRSWSPSGRISGSTMGTMPFCRDTPGGTSGWGGGPGVTRPRRGATSPSHVPPDHGEVPPAYPCVPPDHGEVPPAHLQVPPPAWRPPSTIGCPKVTWRCHQTMVRCHQPTARCHQPISRCHLQLGGHQAP